MTNRDRLMARFTARNPKREKRYKGNAVGVHGDPFGKLGNLSPGTRIKRGRNRITEDDPRWRRKGR